MTDEHAESGEADSPDATQGAGRRGRRRRKAHAVSLGDPGGADHNTIVLGGLDVTVPLEMDLDDDPLQDDEVRIVGRGRFYEQHVRASDPEAEALLDEQLILYRFHDVPPGVYRVQVRVGGRWRTVVHGLLVAREGARTASNRAAAERPVLKLGRPRDGGVGEDD